MNTPLRHLLIAGVVFPGLALAQQPAAGTGTAERLPALQTQFENRVNADAEEPFRKGLAELNGKYAQALNQAFLDAQKGGKWEEALQLRSESERLTKGEALPPSDPANASENLKRLRTTYRQSHALLAARRGDTLANLRKVYAAELEKLVADLTRQGNLEAALAAQTTIKSLREQAANESANAAAPAPIRVAAPGSGDLSRATKSAPFVNSLGMKFVPVPGTEVLFCIHETRYQDYEAFAKETPGLNEAWKNQTIEGITLEERAGEHPVVGVNWTDAMTFCAWLSTRDGKTYRLPTDREWSVAVGIGSEEKWERDTTPESISKAQDVFPWGKDFPPPMASGNYGDESRKEKSANAKFLEGYRDGFPTTSPVMSFEVSRHGLFDLGGNAWEWVKDWFNNKNSERTLRGGSWDCVTSPFMLSAYRDHAPPSYRRNNIGFRIVVDKN